MGEKKEKKDKEKKDKEKKDKEKKEKKEKATVRSAPDGSDNQGTVVDHPTQQKRHSRVSARHSLH